MIVARVRRSIAERGLLAPGSHVLVACSGGPDSAALLWALCELSGPLRLRLTAASVDHGLRPDAAADVACARAQAAALAVPFRALSLSLAPGPGLQARAREARYAALTALAAELGASAVAVGHTLDDQAETVLMRLLRGASAGGLGGVQPRRKDGVVRPLIDCRREDVHACAAQHFGEVARDPTNSDPRFLRARVRQGLLPALRAEDGNIEQHLAELADDVRELGLLVDALAAPLWAEAHTATGDLRISPLSDAPLPVAMAVLRRWIDERLGAAPGRAVLTQLHGLLRGRGEVWLRGGARARLDDDRIVLLTDGGETSAAALLDAGSRGAKVCRD